MRKRGLCCGSMSVYPSVCRSRWWIVFHTAENIVKLPCRPGSAIIQFFGPPAALVPDSKGNPFNGGANYKGWENFAIFDLNRRLPRKRYEIGSWLLWNVYRKLYALYRMVTFSVTLRTPNLVFKVTAFLKSNISKLCFLMGTKLL